MKRRVWNVAGMVLGICLICGCGGSEKTETGTAGAETGKTETAEAAQKELDVSKAEEAAKQASGPIELTFWYSLGGASSDAIQELVAEFNESQDRYVMTAEYQGKYGDALLKFMSSPDDQRPDVLHMNESGTSTLLDAGAYYPVQQFIDDGSLDISEYMENVLNAYRYEDKMYAFPFSITVPAVYYNQEVLEKAGVEPAELATYSGFKAACEKISSSGAAPYGGCIVQDTWIYEQLMASMGLPVVDADNGRDGRATKLVADENGGLGAVLSVIRDFNSQDYSFVSSQAPDVRTAFANQEVAMYIETAGNFGVTNEIVAGAFTMQQAPLFTMDGYEDGLPYASGATLWIIDRGADEKALGVIEFIKFFMLQEKQVEFSLRSGYLPIRADVMENPQYKDYIANVNPGSWKIVEKVMNSTWPGGALFGSLGEFRRNVASQVVAMAEDPSITVETAVEQIARDTNEQIELYNLSN